MRIDVQAGFAPVIAALTAEITAAAEDAVADTLPDAKQDLRDQVGAAGLGQRLARTWQGKAYPNRGTNEGAAGFIWSKAPAIIEAFARGAEIRPVKGARYLWIPTKNVPRLRGGRMKPAQVEARFGSRFIIRPGKRGSLLALIDVLHDRGRARAAGARRRARPKPPVLMFVLRRTVRLPKLLDLQGAADRWGDRYAAALTRRLEEVA